MRAHVVDLPEHRQNKTSVGIMLACVAFGLFAMSDAAAKSLSSDYTVLQILFLGSVFAFVPILFFIQRTDGLTSIRPRRPGWCFLRGGLTAVSVLAIVWSFTKLPLADGYTLAFTAPLIVGALSAWLLQEPVAGRQWIGIFIGFLGVLIILRPGFSTLSAGHIAALGSAAIFALSLIILRRLGDTETPGSLLMTYLLSTVLIYGPVVGFVWITPDSWFDWFLLGGLGLASGFGQIALVLAFRAAPAAFVSPFQYTQLIWGLIFGAVIFGDHPEPLMLIGAALIMGSGWSLLQQSPLPPSQGED